MRTLIFVPILMALVVTLVSGCPKPRTSAPQTNLPMVCHDAAAEGQATGKCATAKQYFEAAADDSLVRMCAPPQDCTYANFRWTKFKNVTTAQKVEVCTLAKISG